MSLTNAERFALPVMYVIPINASVANAAVPAVRPSRPSVRFTAFDTPVRMNVMTGM